MVVDATRRAAMISMEYAYGFLKAIVNEKAFIQEKYTYGTAGCVFYKGSSDGGSAEKVEAMKAAIQTVVNAGYTLPKELRVYTIADASVQNKIYTRDPLWMEIYYTTLGPTTCTDSGVASISNGAHPGFTKGHVTCLHELGHALHAMNMGEDFLATNANGGVTGAPTGGMAVQVSMYAGNSKKEFVAEVFAGMMIGRTYSSGVMAEYHSYNGPKSLVSVL